MQNTAETVEHMVEMRKGYPSHAPGEKNMAAKDWQLRSPSGKIFYFRNLAHFIRNHRGLFTTRELEHFSGRHDCIAYAMISALRPGRSRRPASWHGWTWAE